MFFIFIDTVLQLLTPIYKEGKDIERLTWSSNVLLYLQAEDQVSVQIYSLSPGVSLAGEYTDFTG
jgi:hypothetical protein